MATYEQLLVDAGGGIIERRKLAKQSGDAHVIIGLGGTGGDCVRQIKKDVFRQIAPDDLDAVVPEYKNIKYLIIDSEFTSFHSFRGDFSEINIDAEILRLSGKNIRNEFANTSALRKRPEMDWLSYHTIGISSNPNDSVLNTGIRQIGRLMFVDQIEEIYQKICSVIEDACTDCNGNLYVHICSGVSGGTGSSILLDTCYLVKKALSELGKVNGNVSGYFFLPDVNLAKPAVAADAPLAEFIKRNGYAALKELDYCMSFGKNGDSFKMNYGSFQIDTNQMPVDVCYLISSIDQFGRTIPNGYDHALHTVVDYILNFLMNIDVKDEESTAAFKLAEHIAPLPGVRQMVQLGHGADIPYRILGISVVEFPIVEIETYVGSKLFEQYDSIFDRMPMESERDDFMKRNHLTYDEICRVFLKGCMEQPDFGDLKADDYKKNGNRPFVAVAEKVYVNNCRVVEANYQQLAEELKDYSKPTDSDSLISRTFASLVADFVINLNYGPIYASRMLMGKHNQNLIHYVDGLIAQNGAQLEYVYHQHELKEEDLKNATKSIETMNFLTQRQRVNAYKEALSEWHAQLCREEALTKLQDLLNVYRDQLVKLQSEFFDMLEQVMFTLRETFKVNMTSLLSADENLGYHWKILSIQDEKVRESLDKEVLSIDLPQNFHKLMESLFDQYKEWIANDANKITKFITGFIVDNFTVVANRTIVSYLEDVYETANPRVLEEKVEKHIIQEHLEKNSELKFWLNPIFNKEVGMQNILTVPFDSKPIIAAADRYVADKYHYLIRLAPENRISMIHIWSGLPLYAYQGLKTLEDAYESGMKLAGRHLFERRDLKEYETREAFEAQVDWNEYLPSPIPASLGQSCERITKRNEALMANFEKAESLGIVRQEYGEYYILSTSPFDIEKFVEENGGIYTNGVLDEDKVTTILVELEKKKLDMLSEASENKIWTVRPISGMERVVALDFYLKSGVLIKLVEDELAKREKIEQFIGKLKEDLANAKKYKVESKIFFKALFTKVLDYGNTIAFSYEEDSVNKIFTLQNSSMPFGASGAYQAFLTYMDMDKTPEGASIKDKIIAEANDRFDNQEYVEFNKAYVEKLMAIMPMRIETYMIIYGTTDPEHDRIRAFYDEMTKELTDFKEMLLTR